MLEKNIDVKEKHWFIVFRMYPNVGSNPQPFFFIVIQLQLYAFSPHPFLMYETMLQLTEPPGQSQGLFF